MRYSDFREKTLKIRLWKQLKNEHFKEKAECSRRESWWSQEQKKGKCDREVFPGQGVKPDSEKKVKHQVKV